MQHFADGHRRERHIDPGYERFGDIKPILNCMISHVYFRLTLNTELFEKMNG